MKDEISREDTTMKTEYETHVRAEKKSGRRMSGLAMAALLAFGFAVPAQAIMMPGDSIDRSVTLATINIPVRLHNIPPLTSGGYGTYSVSCTVKDMSGHYLNASGLNEEAISSGEVNTTLVIRIHPIVGRSRSRVNPSQLASWQCHLTVQQQSGAGLAGRHAPGTTLRTRVIGSF